MSQIVGVILAGGKSTRMGSDKASLIYKGINLLDRAKSKFNEAGINDIYISGKQGIHDLIPNLGAIGGIYSVTKLFNDEQEIIIIPVDMPLLSVELINILCANRNNYDAIYFKNFIMPLKLKLTKSVKEYIDNIALGNTLSLSIKSLLDNINVQKMEIKDTDISSFSNINTPDEWKKINEITL